MRVSAYCVARGKPPNNGTKYGSQRARPNKWLCPSKVATTQTPTPYHLEVDGWFT